MYLTQDYFYNQNNKMNNRYVFKLLTTDYTL